MLALDSAIRFGEVHMHMGPIMQSETRDDAMAA